MASWLPVPFRVAIIGSGLSGLSAAHTVLKHAQIPTEVTLIESQDRVGGWLESTRFDDGTVFEHGPRSARSYGHVALDALSVVSCVWCYHKRIHFSVYLFLQISRILDG